MSLPDWKAKKTELWRRLETQETEKVYMKQTKPYRDGYESGLPDGVPADPTTFLSKEETSDGWKERDSQKRRRPGRHWAGETKLSEVDGNKL